MVLPIILIIITSVGVAFFFMWRAHQKIIRTSQANVESGEEWVFDLACLIEIGCSWVRIVVTTAIFATLAIIALLILK